MRTARPRRPRIARWLLVLGSGSAVVWWQVRTLGDVRYHLGAFFGYFALAFLCYLAVLWRLHRLERVGASDRSYVLLLVVILLGAVAFRLMLLGTIPTLSNDPYRSRWGG